MPLINAYLGIGRTLHGAFAGFIGTTTIQPAHALHVWMWAAYGLYGTHDDGSPYFFGMKLIVRRDPVTGNVHYRTSGRDSRTAEWYFQHDDPFVVGDTKGRMARMTTTCVPTPGAPYVYNIIENFSLTVWTASIIKSGYFPPAAPYESYLKSDVESEKYNCDDTDYTASFGTARSHTIYLGDSGIQNVTMPIVQRKYAFPMLQWVGKWSDY
ncbi:MAG: hypothetical protein FJ387_25640 [Verrucomicrobia bacterium]|nr:hypothetical protein [Verrucomicrobiota bacterium]